MPTADPLRVSVYRKAMHEYIEEAGVEFHVHWCQCRLRIGGVNAKYSNKGTGGEISLLEWFPPEASLLVSLVIGVINRVATS